MLCAVMNNNNEVELVQDKTIPPDNFASYEDLDFAICCGYIELKQFTMVKEGVMIWYEEECDFDFVRFMN